MDAAAIVAAGSRLAAHGLIVGAEGNLSVRLADGRLLVTPGGRRKDQLGEADLVEVTLEPPRRPPARRGLAPTSDLALHRAIYRARPDVSAIAHAHIPAAMALTLAGEHPDPAVLPETALLLPDLPVVPYGTMGSEELAQRVARAFAASGSASPSRTVDAVLLERHGAIAVGATIEQAVDRLDLVDVLCRTWRDARLLAPQRPLLPPISADDGATERG
jgi:L-fuculose-phosphate aldolase